MWFHRSFLYFLYKWVSLIFCPSDTARLTISTCGFCLASCSILCQISSLSLSLYFSLGRGKTEQFTVWFVSELQRQHKRSLWALLNTWITNATYSIHCATGGGGGDCCLTCVEPSCRDYVFLFASSHSSVCFPLSSSLHSLLLLLGFVLLGAIIKQLLVHLHKELQSIVNKPMDCPVAKRGPSLQLDNKKHCQYRKSHS